MNHNDYWQSRTNEILDTNSSNKEIRKLYKKEYKKMENELIELFNKMENEGLTRSEICKSQHYLNVCKSLEKSFKGFKTILTENVTKGLKDCYKATYEVTNKQYGLDLTFNPVNTQMMNKLINTKYQGKHFSKRIWKNTDKLSKRIEADVATMLANGTSKSVFIKSISSDYGVGLRQSERLVRTESMHVINQAQKDTYKEAGITKLMIYAAEDERMCEICGEYHENIINISDTEIPPFHCDCRCTLIPIVE